MKIGGIKNITEAVGNNIRNFKINQKQAKIDSLVNIENIHQNDVYKVLNESKEMMANYAAANGVKISFRSFPENKCAEQMSNRMLLSVSNGTFNQLRIIPTEVAKTYNSETKKVLMLKNKDGNDYIATVKSNSEDSFIRFVYRNVVELTKHLTK